MKEFETFYKDLYLVVKGYYSEGEAQTYDYPGSPDNFSICEVNLQGVDVSILMADHKFTNVKERKFKPKFVYLKSPTLDKQYYV